MFATYTDSRFTTEMSSPNPSRPFSIQVELSPQQETQQLDLLLGILSSFSSVPLAQEFSWKVVGTIRGSRKYHISNYSFKALKSLSAALVQLGIGFSVAACGSGDSSDGRSPNNRYQARGSDISIDEFPAGQAGTPDLASTCEQAKFNLFGSTCSRILPYGNSKQQETTRSHLDFPIKKLTSFHNLRNETSLGPTAIPTIRLEIGIEGHLYDGFINPRILAEVDRNHQAGNLHFKGLTSSSITTDRLKSRKNNQPDSSKKQLNSCVQKKEKKPSTVVFVKGLTLKDASLEMIVNLFECFGTVVIAMYHRKREYTLVKYSSTLEAKLCIKELYGKEIFPGKGHLLLHYSEYEDISPKYYSNEKLYYEPQTDQMLGLVPKKIGHLSRNVLITVNSYPGITLQQHIGLIEDRLHKLFSFTPIKQTSSTNEYIAEFQGVKVAISFVMDNNFRELIEGLAFITLTFAPRLTHL
jgi:hypothetical protein